MMTNQQSHRSKQLLTDISGVHHHHQPSKPTFEHHARLRLRRHRGQGPEPLLLEPFQPILEPPSNVRQRHLCPPITLLAIPRPYHSYWHQGAHKKFLHCPHRQGFSTSASLTLRSI